MSELGVFCFKEQPLSATLADGAASMQHSFFPLRSTGCDEVSVEGRRRKVEGDFFDLTFAACERGDQ